MFRTKALLVVSVLALAAIISISYFYAGALAASSVTQQSYQSSSSTTTNNNGTVTSSRIESSLSSDGIGLKEDMQQLSGKIASSQLNLTTGAVEAVLFGDWALKSSSGEASFDVNFTQTLQADNSTVDYEIGNITVNSVQRVNDSLVLSGSADVGSTNATLTANDVPITVMIINGEMMALSVGGDSAMFGGLPVIGVVVAKD